MTEKDLFSIKDLYPKEVIDKNGKKDPFDENKIKESLENMGLNKEDTNNILKAVIRKIIGFGVDIISTDIIKECIESLKK